MIGFIIGLFTGGMVGFIAAGLLHSAREQDRVIEEFYEQQKGYQPQGNLNTSKPPKNGSGVPQR